MDTLMETIIYELHAEGNSLNGWRFRAVSQSLYTSKELAESEIESFRLKCTDQTKLDCAEEEDLKITVRERILCVSV